MHFSVTKSSGYESLDDIFRKKRPVRLLTNTGGLPLLEKMILPFYGLTIDDIKKWGGNVLVLAYADWPGTMRDGHADAMFNPHALPSSQLGQVTQYMSMKLLSLPKDLRDNIENQHNLGQGIIPKTTYPKAQKDDVRTNTRSQSLLVSAKVSDGIVYEILRIFDDNLKEIRQIHPTFANFDLKTASQFSGVPLHAGAKRYYQEKGYMK
jgi:TRAP transporter TAXI family solute receptor